MSEPLNHPDERATEPIPPAPDHDPTLSDSAPPPPESAPLSADSAPPPAAPASSPTATTPPPVESGQPSLTALPLGAPPPLTTPPYAASAPLPSTAAPSRRQSGLFASRWFLAATTGVAGLIIGVLIGAAGVGLVGLVRHHGPYRGDNRGWYNNGPGNNQPPPMRGRR